MTFNDLVLQYEDLKIMEYDFSKIDPEEEISGLCINEKIFIRKNLCMCEKTCILAEELGHYFTSTGNILDLTDIGNVKQEKRARNWAYEKLIPLNKLIEASDKGIRNRFELSEFLDVTEDFIDEAIIHYREKYGPYVICEQYIIFFEPLCIYKNLDKEELHEKSCSICKV